MKLTITRSGLRIESESDQDLAFIEDSLGLRANGDSVAMTRVDLNANHQFSHLETIGRARRARGRR
jgi:hypothetical protein